VSRPGGPPEPCARSVPLSRRTGLASGAPGGRGAARCRPARGFGRSFGRMRPRRALHWFFRAAGFARCRGAGSAGGCRFRRPYRCCFRPGCSLDRFFGRSCAGCFGTGWLEARRHRTLCLPRCRLLPCRLRARCFRICGFGPGGCLAPARRGGDCLGPRSGVFEGDILNVGLGGALQHADRRSGQGDAGGLGEVGGSLLQLLDERSSLGHGVRACVPVRCTCRVYLRADPIVRMSLPAGNGIQR